MTNFCKNEIIKGYDVFGKEYGYMLRNDLHDNNSIEHKLMQQQVLLNEASEKMLYHSPVNIYPMEGNELFEYSQRYRKKTDYESIISLLDYTKEVAEKFDVELQDMIFGGTEKQILERGTDWCFDMARLSAVILDSIAIPSRFVFVANPFKAYNGHVLLETYYEKSWGLVDPLFGYIFYDGKPIPAKNINKKNYLAKYDQNYSALFQQIAIADYDPNDKSNIYNTSKCNEYTLKLNSMQQNGKWLLGEDEASDQTSSSSYTSIE